MRQTPHNTIDHDFTAYPPRRRTLISRIVHVLGGVDDPNLNINSFDPLGDAIDISAARQLQQEYQNSISAEENGAIDLSAAHQLHRELQETIALEARANIPPATYQQEQANVHLSLEAAKANQDLLDNIRNCMFAEGDVGIQRYYIQQFHQRFYPVWTNLWEKILYMSHPVDVSQVDFARTPLLAQQHIQAFKTYYELNDFVVPCGRRYNDTILRWWLYHGLTPMKIQFMRRIIVETAVNRYELPGMLKYYNIDRLTLERILHVAEKVYRVRHCFDIVDTTQIKMTDIIDTFSVPLDPLLGDVVHARLQEALKELARVLDGELTPADYGLPPSGDPKDGIRDKYYRLINNFLYANKVLLYQQYDSLNLP